MNDLPEEPLSSGAEAFVAEWLRGRFEPPPLTADQRAVLLEAIGRCYAAAGMAAPDAVIWAQHPVDGRLAATRAATELRRRRTVAAAPRLRWSAHLGAAVRTGVAVGVRWLRLHAHHAAIGAGSGAVVAAVLLSPLWLWWVIKRDESWPFLLAGSAAGAAISAAIGRWVASDTWRIETRAKRLATHQAATAASVAEMRSTSSRIAAACLGNDRVRSRERRRARELVGNPIVDAVLTLDTFVRWGAPDRATRSATAAVRLVDEALSATGRLARARRKPPPAPELWSDPDRTREIGRIASLVWLIERGALRPRPDRLAVIRAFEHVSSYDWWPHPDFVAVSVGPEHLHVEQDPQGGYRLHQADGPAVR
ncbi:hypothetical protein [Cryptosporangium sp. NPDC048952]|uniref:hypothetical protein n=1 Tax=Cryptosporangium sp. NPDC048952 TaxID=3363961 RepID=UPI003715B6D0